MNRKNEYKKNTYLFAMSLLSFALIIALSNLAHEIYMGKPLSIVTIKETIYTTIGLLFLAPMAMVVGPFVGLVNTAPYFTMQFKMMLVAILSVAFCIFILGQKFNRNVWGNLLKMVSFWLFFGAGLLSFGPQ